VEDRRRGQAVADDRGPDARAAPAELLLEETAREVVEPRAAVLRGRVGVHQADLPGLLDDLLRPGRVTVVVPGHGPDLVLRELVRHAADVLLLVGEGEVDHWPSAPCGRRSRLLRSARLISQSTSTAEKNTFWAGSRKHGVDEEVDPD